MIARTPEDRLQRDHFGLDTFERAMRHKLRRKHDAFLNMPHWSELSQVDLSRMLREHVEKGDPVDVANFCMMIHENGMRIEPLPDNAVPLRRNGAVAFSLSALVRHAFFSGAGVANDGKISEEQQAAYAAYSPPSSYHRIVNAILHGTACSHALQVVKDHLLRMGWKPDSIMIEGIDKALEPLE